jgi:hypothetical protein
LLSNKRPVPPLPSGDVSLEVGRALILPGEGDGDREGEGLGEGERERKGAGVGERGGGIEEHSPPPPSKPPPPLLRVRPVGSPAQAPSSVSSTRSPTPCGWWAPQRVL